MEEFRQFDKIGERNNYTFYLIIRALSTRIRYVFPKLTEKEDFDRNRLVIKNVANYKVIKSLIYTRINNNKYETLFN